MKETSYYPKRALELFRNNYQLLVILSLIIAGVGLVFDLLTQFFPSLLSGPLSTTLILILRVLLLALFNIALFRVVKNIITGKKSVLADEITSSKSRYRDYIVLSIILFIIIFAGTILLVIPGIIFAVWYFASAYLTATEDMKPLNALDLSKKRVEGMFWPVLGRFLVSFLAIPLPFIIIVSAIASLGSQTLEVAAYVSIFTNFLFVLILSPYLYLIVALIYEDLKTVKQEH